MNISPININSIFKIQPKTAVSIPCVSRLNHDVVSFTGAAISDYKTNFDAYCSRLTKYRSAFSSPTDFDIKAQAKYDALVKDMFTENGHLNPKYRCELEWPIGTPKPQDMPITDSRKQIITEWIDFLANPKYQNKQGMASGENESEIVDTLEVIKNTPSLKLIILDTMLYDIKTDNKHISPPLNPYAIAKTVKKLDSIPRGDVGAFSFLGTYRSELINLVIERAKDSDKYPPEQRKSMIEAFPYSSNNVNGMWIKIPSKAHNKHNLNNNIRAVEIISHENWCTKNATYKAAASLEEGDFYVFLENQKNGEYKPTIGMALCKNTIFQIQNPSNNDRVAAKYLPVVDYIVSKQGLEFDYYQRDDGIPAGRQYEITKRLKSVFNGKTLETAIKENDAETIFQYAGIEYEKDEDGLLVLQRYKPKVVIRNGQVPPILFYELGIDEYALLSKVSRIKGATEFENSKINSLPQNLKSLGNRVTIRPEQFSEGCKSRYKTMWIETHKTRIIKD